MADPTDFATAFAAIRVGGKSMRRAPWDVGATWTWFAGTQTSDPMVVQTSGSRVDGFSSVGVNDLVATDWIVEDLPPPEAPPA